MKSRAAARVRFAVGYVALGGAVLVGLSLLSDQLGSFPSWPLWAMFAAAFALLEWRSVEVNDRLMMTSSVMVLATAGVVFALEGANVPLGMAAAAAIGLFERRDFQEKRWFQPTVNFGQLVLSAAAAGLVLAFAIRGPIDEVTPSLVAAVALASFLAASLHAVLNIGQVAWIVRSVFGRRQIRPWSGMGTLVPYHVVTGATGGLFAVLYVSVGFAVLPLILLMFVAAHHAFASYSSLREAHEVTLRGFIKALEAKDLYTRGHTERVAYFCQLIGQELNYRGTRLEKLRVAALIHDVGKLAVPRDLIRKRSRLTDEEYTQLQAHAHVVEDILAEVDFLRPMVQIASGHHPRFDGYTGSGHRHDLEMPQESRVLAVADAFDAMTSTRSYRMALSQDYALSELSRDADDLDRQVIDALTAGLRRTGERYGSPQLNPDHVGGVAGERRPGHE